MKEYYVYELWDCSDQNNPKVFYVGKGIGNRVRNHAALVEEKLKCGEAILDGKESVLAKLIMEKKGNANSLMELVIGRYETESEALAVEATLIKWIYGRDALENAVHGHGADQIRDKGDRNLDHELQPGTYGEERVANIEARGILDRAADLGILLTKLGFQSITGDYLRNSEYGLWWKIPEFPVEVQIKFQTGSNKVVLNARPSLQRHEANSIDRKEDHGKFIKILELAGYHISGKNDSRLSFAALFESTRVGGVPLNQQGQLHYRNHTGIEIELFTSIHDGIEASNYELIGNYLRELQIRLSLAKISMKGSIFDQSQLTEIIKLYKAKPATKLFGRNDGAEYFD